MSPLTEPRSIVKAAFPDYRGRKVTLITDGFPYDPRRLYVRPAPAIEAVSFLDYRADDSAVGWR